MHTFSIHRLHIDVHIHKYTYAYTRLGTSWLRALSIIPPSCGMSSLGERERVRELARARAPAPPPHLSPLSLPLSPALTLLSPLSLMRARAHTHTLHLHLPRPPKWAGTDFCRLTQIPPPPPKKKNSRCIHTFQGHRGEISSCQVQISETSVYGDFEEKIQN